MNIKVHSTKRQLERIWLIPRDESNNDGRKTDKIKVLKKNEKDWVVVKVKIANFYIKGAQSEC